MYGKAAAPSLGLSGDPFLAERLEVARRAIRGLPDPLLQALARGLSGHADGLISGRLFGPAPGQGCAVGVALQELDPERFARRDLRFRLVHLWRRRLGWYRRDQRLNPRLRHLEWTFDESVKRLRELDQRLTDRSAATVIGCWWRAEAEAELDWRSLRSLGPVEARERQPAVEGSPSC